MRLPAVHGDSTLGNTLASCEPTKRCTRSMPSSPGEQDCRVRLSDYWPAERCDPWKPTKQDRHLHFSVMLSAGRTG